MTERWQRELLKLRRLEPSNDLMERAREGPRRPAPRSRERLVAGLIGVVVASAGIALGAWVLRGHEVAPGSEGSSGSPERTGGVVGNGRIAFAVHHFEIGERGSRVIVREADADIYAMNQDGTDLSPLVATPQWENRPSWSPDGTRIAFNDEQAIYVMNAEGSGRERVAEGQEPVWSPDGTRIAFVRPRDLPEGRYESPIYVVNADGTGPVKLYAGVIASGLTWSPDGSLMAFAGVTNDPNASDFSPKIYVMNADGTGVRKLDDGSSPAWSPDGTKIAFLAFSEAGRSDIYAMAPDGSGVTRLTFLEHASAPVWAPDGSKILFGLSIPEDAGGLSTTGLFVMNPDGTDVVQLIESGADPLLGPNTAIGTSSWQPVPDSRP